MHSVSKRSRHNDIQAHNLKRLSGSHCSSAAKHFEEKHWFSTLQNILSRWWRFLWTLQIIMNQEILMTSIFIASITPISAPSLYLLFHYYERWCDTAAVQLAGCRLSREHFLCSVCAPETKCVSFGIMTAVCCGENWKKKTALKESYNKDSYISAWLVVNLESTAMSGVFFVFI